MSRFMDIWGPFLVLACLGLMIPGVALLLAPYPWWIFGILLFLPLAAIMFGTLAAGFFQLWKDSMKEWKEGRE